MLLYWGVSSIEQLQKTFQGKKLAVFDVDGVIVQGNLAFEGVKTLYDSGNLTKPEYDALEDLGRRYKQGELTQDEAVVGFARHYAKGVAGKHINEIERVFMKVVEKSTLSDRAEEAIKHLHDQEIEVLLLSASPIEAIKILAQQLSVTYYVGTSATLDTNNRYTGEVGLPILDTAGKRNLLKQLGISPVLGVGDSLGDLAILETARVPLVFNPRDKLRDLGLKKKWCVYDTNYDLLAAIKRALPPENKKGGR